MPGACSVGVIITVQIAVQKELMMTDRKVRWGIISTANIGMTKVTPGIMKSPHSEVIALASRDHGSAERALN